MKSFLNRDKIYIYALQWSMAFTRPNFTKFRGAQRNFVDM